MHSWVVSSFFPWWFSCIFLTWLSLLICYHPDSANITGHSLLEALQTAVAEYGISYSRHSLPIPLLPENFGVFLPVPLDLWLRFPPFPCQDQQGCLSPGAVSPHLSCYCRFLALELLGSCAALNVSGMLFQGDSTRRWKGLTFSAKIVISHALGCLTFLFAASKSQDPY